MYFETNFIAPRVIKCSFELYGDEALVLFENMLPPSSNTDDVGMEIYKPIYESIARMAKYETSKTL